MLAEKATNSTQSQPESEHVAHSTGTAQAWESQSYHCVPDVELWGLALLCWASTLLNLTPLCCFALLSAWNP